MQYFGDYAEDATVYIYFTTSDGSGGAVAPSSAFEAADVDIYKDGSATQKTSTNGLTMTSPFDSTTGLHVLAIDTSVDTGDAGFWVTGSDFTVVLTPDETVDSQTVAAVIGHFSIENRTTYPKADVPTNFSALGIESDGDITKVNTLDGHTAQTGDSYARLGAPAGASIAADLATIDTEMATVDSNVDTLVARVPNTVSLANINAEVDTALADYDPPTRAELTSDIGGLDTKIDTIDTNVDAILVDTGTDLPATLTDIQGATFDTSTDSLEAIRNRGDSAWITATGFSTHTAANVRTEMDSNSTQLAAILADTAEIGAAGAGLTALATQASVDTIDSIVDAILVDTGTTLETHLTDIKGATFSGATDSLEAIRDRGDAEWITGGGGSAPTVSEIRIEMDSNSTQLAAIVADTNELQADWADGGRLDSILDELTTQGDTNESKIDTIDTEVGVIDGIVDSILVDTGTTLPASIATIDTNVDAILVDTAEIGVAGAGLTNINLPNQTMDIVGNITGSLSGSVGSLAGHTPQTADHTANIASILTDTGTTIPAQITGLNNLSAADVNAEVDTALSDIHLDHLFAATYDPASKPGTADALLNEIFENDGGVSRFTTNSLENAPGGGSSLPSLLQSTTIATLASQTSFTLTAGSADDDAYNNQIIVVTDQSTSTQKAVGIVQDYVGSTRTVTLDSDPGIFTMAVSDTVDIIATSPAASAPSAAAIRSEIDSNSTQLAAIVSDTNELQTDWANGGRLDLILDELTTQGDTNEGKIDTIDTNVDAVLVDTGTTLPATLATIDSEIGVIDGIVDTILADTAELQANQGNWLTATGFSTHSAADVRTEMDANSTQLAAIVADTNEVQADWADGGRLDLILDELTAQGDTNEGKIDTIDTNVDSVLVDTGTTLPATLATIDSNVDAVLVDTGTTLPATLATILADTNELQTDDVPGLIAALNDIAATDIVSSGAITTSGGAVTTVTSVTNQVTADVTGISGSATAANNLELSALSIISGSATATTLTTTTMSTDLTEATDDHYNGRVIIWTSGVLVGQATDITDYTGSTKLLTFTAVTEAPGSSDTFIII